MERKKKEYNLC